MNKNIMMGRLTKDVDLRKGNTTYCMFSIAVPRSYCKAGEKRESDFFNCKAFGPIAEHIAKYFKKGNMIAFDSELRNNNWTDKQGINHYGNELHIKNVYFTGEKLDNNNTNNTNNNNNNNQEQFENDDTELPWG